MKYYLSKFDAISIREKSGVELCKKELEIDAEWKIDPAFLTPKSEYQKIADSSATEIQIGFRRKHCTRCCKKMQT